MFGNTGFFDGGATGPIIRDFTANGTWTRPAGLVYACVYAVGAGGGGGGGGGINTGLFPTRSASGGAGGGGGGVSSCCYTCASLSASHCVIIGAGGAGGARAATAGSNGTIGSVGGNSCFGALAIANGGSPGSGGCYCSVACCIILVSPGAGGAGTTYNGNVGGTGCINPGAGGSSFAASTSTLGGAGGGSGCAAIPSTTTGAGGPESCYLGLRLGKGGDTCFNNQTPPNASPYGAAGGGGNAGTWTGASCPLEGGAGASGIVRVVEYYS